jgi:hypothetical protein
MPPVPRAVRPSQRLWRGWPSRSPSRPSAPCPLPHAQGWDPTRCESSEWRARASAREPMRSGLGSSRRRCARTSTVLNGHLARFPQVGQVVQLTRAVTERGGSSTDIAHFITSCTPRQADPARLLALIRGHWGIKRQHWLRDVVFGEDHSHLRTRSAPQILAALRNTALTLLRRTGRSAITSARRSFAAHPTRAFALLRRRFRANR